MLLYMICKCSPWLLSLNWLLTTVLRFQHSQPFQRSHYSELWVFCLSTDQTLVYGLANCYVWSAKETANSAALGLLSSSELPCMIGSCRLWGVDPTCAVETTHWLNIGWPTCHATFCFLFAGHWGVGNKGWCLGASSADPKREYAFNCEELSTEAFKPCQCVCSVCLQQLHRSLGGFTLLCSDIFLISSDPDLCDSMSSQKASWQFETHHQP